MTGPIPILLATDRVHRVTERHPVPLTAEEIPAVQQSVRAPHVMLAVLAACLLAVLVFFGHGHMPTSLGLWLPPLT